MNGKNFLEDEFLSCLADQLLIVRQIGSVKTSPGCGDSRRKLPPFAAGLVRVAVAILVAPRGKSCNWVSAKRLCEALNAISSPHFTLAPRCSKHR